LYLLNLCKIQNKAIRITHGSSPKADTTTIIKTSEILTFSQLIKFETAKFIHKYVNKKLPSIFDSYFVLANTTYSRNKRFSTHQNFHIPLYKTKRLNFQLNSLERKFVTRFHQILETLHSLILQKSLKLIFLKIHDMFSYH